MWYRFQDRHADQQNRTESLEISHCIYGHCDSDRSARTVQQADLPPEWCQYKAQYGGTLGTRSSGVL